jgi:cell wall assembly regulator SMI1
MGLAESWERILKWYGANTPEGTLTPSHGATRDQLGELEALVGERLPDDFQESYLLHDGTREGWLLFHGSLRSLAGIAKEWQMYRKWQDEDGYGKGADWQPVQLESPEIKPIWWSPLRLPITDNGGGDPVTLDLDPAPTGKRGQIIKFNHEVGPINLLGSGMGDWLAWLATELESGIHAYSESSMMVCPVAWGRT